MSPTLVLVVVGAYFLLLFVISTFTSRGADTATFFRANRQSPWYLVAFGMVGASLSGVTFISVPGWVGDTQFGYLQMVMGYLPGYLVIATVLMPLYYRLNLTSIYGYLHQRFGLATYRTGAGFFLLSRTIGSAFRLFLVANVLQIALFDAWQVPFEATVALTIFLIWLYTYRGGIKTVVWTDTLQTLFMLLAVGISLWLVIRELGIAPTELPEALRQSNYGQVFFWGEGKQNFFKQFVGGAFIAIVMTGLDQDMMQKNLTCRSLGDAQKNMFWFSTSLVFVNLLFLSLGAALYLFAEARGIALPARTDDLYPLLAFQYFPPLVGILFLLGVIAAAYSSADSALTALTTSFCVDFLGFEHQTDEHHKKRVRQRVHVGFSVLLFLVIVAFRAINDESVVSAVFTWAGYTYGPLLGLFSFGLFWRRPVRDAWVPVVCLVSPLLTYALNWLAPRWLGYTFGFELVVLNGAITFVGLWLLSRRVPAPRVAATPAR